MNYSLKIKGISSQISVLSEKHYKEMKELKEKQLKELEPLYVERDSLSILRRRELIDKWNGIKYAYNKHYKQVIQIKNMYTNHLGFNLVGHLYSYNNSETRLSIIDNEDTTQMYKWIICTNEPTDSSEEYYWIPLSDEQYRKFASSFASIFEDTSSKLKDLNPLNFTNNVNK